MLKYFLLLLLLLLHVTYTGSSWLSAEIARHRRRRSCGAVNGGWSGWITTSGCNCNHATGIGYISQARHCNRPAPSCGGAGCGGASTQNIGCSCCKTTPGGWTPWAGWGKCNCDSNTGTGTRGTTRYCTNPAPSCGGATCAGGATKSERCDDQCCKKSDGGWSPYGPFTKCTCDSSTGKGNKSAVKTCTNPVPSCGGAMCEGSAIKIEGCDEECRVKVDGGWSAWSAWVSDCDTKCGTGVQKRDRRCTAPQCNGKECQGVNKVTAECSNTCGVVIGEGSMTSGGPVKVKCTLYGNTRKFMTVQWKTKGGRPIVNGGNYGFLPDVVTPYYSTMSMVVSNLQEDAEYVCSFVFGQGQAVESKVLVDFVEMSFIMDWN